MKRLAPNVYWASRMIGCQNSQQAKSAPSYYNPDQNGYGHDRGVLTKAPRLRTVSQPTILAGHTYACENDATHGERTLGYVQEPRNPDFRDSVRPERCKALCIGINYVGQPYELRGCINDADHVRRFLIATNPEQTYQEFLTNLRNILDPRYSQNPQLGSSHKIDINCRFRF
ncbi:hypothetical protein HYPSUDRAFT_914034 [Hypholoma sublateritium FD-334 SS-4]|uniref:Uncharacterized protein n=1 Tax=Hypholoma sublateritium (strain FD-334 SS-4) TaxID=945553 RepID=A0A0D2NIX0_HYPSF|nr:hypothetical protein HYPSUDRAFT_914034 [Hypholoma sublateritium FD-334 SS-4]